MGDPDPKRVKHNPRMSAGFDGSISRQADTPSRDLHALANVINRRPITPLRRASSAGPLPTSYTRTRTPGTNNRIPATVSRTPRNNILPGPLFPRRGPPTTPHAIRALQQRRNAALTPRAQRRRSGKIQRETPRDTLRALSRVMAGKSQPILPTTLKEEIQSPRNPALETFDEGPDIVPPRLSMPLDDDEDDSFDVPPRLSSVALEDLEDLTLRSFEGVRRALSEGPRHRFSMGGRFSSQFGDINVFESPGIDAEGTFMRADSDELLINEDTLRLGDEFGSNPRTLPRHQQGGLDSQDPTVDESQIEPTFQLHIPQRARFQSPTHSPTQQGRATGSGSAEYDWDDQDEEQGLGGVINMDDGSHQAVSRGFQISDYEGDNIGVTDATPPIRSSGKKTSKIRKGKEHKFSKHGIQYPSLPTAVVKNLTSSFLRQHGQKKSRVRQDVLAEVMLSTDWFLEQIGWDLTEYSRHAHRSRIDETDVVCLMKRQRQLSSSATPFSLAQKYLPRELLQNIRMPQPTKAKKPLRKLKTIGDAEEDGQ